VTMTMTMVLQLLKEDQGKSGNFQGHLRILSFMQYINSANIVIIITHIIKVQLEAAGLVMHLTWFV
jgi:hypothetical protein